MASAKVPLGDQPCVEMADAPVQESRAITQRIDLDVLVHIVIFFKWFTKASLMKRQPMKQDKSLPSTVVGVAMAYFMSLLFAGSIDAQPLYVTVSSAQYMTYVEGFQETNNDGTGYAVSRTTTSPVPISDELDTTVMLPFGQTGTNHAIANAGLFGVSDQTGWGFANAEAVSQIWFSPMADQTQTLNIYISAEGRGEPYAFTSGQISLLDLTANHEVWNYSWDEGGSAFVPVQVPPGDNIPWEPFSGTVNFTVDTDFLASHQFELTMIVCSNAGDDSETAQIQLTGLQAVPEPSPAFLLTLCGAALAIRRRGK